MIDTLIIVGDEAWTPEELARETASWEYRERKAKRTTESPEARAHRLAYSQAYRAIPENRDKHRAYNREWQRRRRASTAIGALHELRCSGPTRATGCRCTGKIPVYASSEEAAA